VTPVKKAHQGKRGTTLRTGQKRKVTYTKTQLHRMQELTTAVFRRRQRLSCGKRGKVSQFNNKIHRREWIVAEKLTAQRKRSG